MSWSPWTMSSGTGAIRLAASAGGMGSGLGQPPAEILVCRKYLAISRPSRFSAAKWTRRIGSVPR
jgi:hypothetical protein